MALSDCPKCWNTPCTCPDGELGRLERIRDAAIAYVREEMADDPRLVEEGGGLHELAKALGLVK